MKKFFAALIYLVITLLLLMSLAIYLVLSAQPQVEQTQPISAQSAKKSQQLARRIVATLKQENSIKSITTKQHEIDGLTALFHRAFPQAHLAVTLSEQGASADASLALPLLGFIRYLNVHAFILPSNQGLQLSQVHIGDISLDGELFLSIVTWLTDRIIQPQLVEKVLKMITAIEINQKQMTTHLALGAVSMDQNGQNSLLLKLRDDLALFGDVNVIRFYYQSLSDFAEQQGEPSSIATFIAYLFELAATRQSISEQYMAVNENQAALMALVIYFGADRFETLVGDIIIREKQQLALRNRMRHQVTLQGRVDLQKHFIYSIALQLFSTHSASDAMGEFKEFLDTNAGGSGFSFADLQADRAGTRLAMIVTKSELNAIRAQKLLSQVTDDQLLPSINGLQEGLTEQSFEQQFSHANSAQYKRTLKEIDNRLRSSPVYQLGWE
ncbi:hypothetical protein [Thalassotalea sp. G2M2-11]|uniref:hypothetical protein n=1 Tax=Thalassotalea sp. G2M2-11 TaxID=2787627 RepID=UPI0019D1E415|nr:hypothetical protein [Thalassotalea sp. G2M2-11]